MIDCNDFINAGFVTFRIKAEFANYVGYDYMLVVLPILQAIYKLRYVLLQPLIQLHLKVTTQLLKF